MNPALQTSAAARINQVALAEAGEALDAGSLRQRACLELLRQAAIEQGLLAADDPPPHAGVVSVAASEAIEQLLDRQVRCPEPSEEACRRHFDANRTRYAIGERVLARHILFGVTAGIDITALRSRAEACLLELRSQPLGSGRFAERAGELSNCPSGGRGGELGWLAEADCAPEFARELFGRTEVGVLPRLVHSRFGLHVVEVRAREPGRIPPFASVREAVAQSLRQQSFTTALRQYLSLLAGAAKVEGVDLEAATDPLVQ
ncbi:MAG: peptidylprolyl isomerase [Burkholderiaceae bacterium]